MRTSIAAAALALALTSSCAGSVSAPQNSPSPGLAVTFKGSGDSKTAPFTVPARWYLAWSYDCRAGLANNGVVPSGASCSFTIDVRRPDGTALTDNNPFQTVGAEGQGVLLYKGGGTFYVEVTICCAVNTWTLAAGDAGRSPSP